MADGLIPDLAPNLYSQGQVGTGYAQVFDLGAPNPFAVTQDYINQTVANKKEAVKTAVENEEKRQQKLDEFLAAIDDIDQPWNMAKVEIGNAIDDYGNKIAEMRAQGTAINSSLLMKEQKKLKDLAKINESNYQKAMKIGTAMQDPLIYTDDEREQFQQSIKDAGNPDKNGSVQKVQEVLDQWQKSVETPNVVEDYKKVKPVAKDTTGYTKKTTEEDFNKAVKAQLTSYQKPQLKKLLKMYQDENRITTQFTSEDIDSNEQAVLDAIETQMKVDLESQKEFDVTPKTSNRYTRSQKEPIFNIGTESIYEDKSELSKINIATGKGANAPAQNFVSGIEGEQSVYMIPQAIQFDTATGESPEGWYIYGKVQQERGTKVANAPGDTEESVLAQIGNPPDTTAKLEGDGYWHFYKLQERRVPYELNKAAMQTYGVESLEAVAKKKGYKSVKKSSSGQTQKTNTQSGEIKVADQGVLKINPN